MKKKIIIISAPSGSGKTTICNKLMQTVDNLEFSISSTTREKREGETHGKEYFFLTLEEFEDKVMQNGFLEYAKVFGNYYGTSKSFVDDRIKNGKVVLFDIDWQGCKQIKDLNKEYEEYDILSIFIMPPSIVELKRRLETRGDESFESIEKRLATAQYEMSKKRMYDHCVINDNLQTATSEVINIVQVFLG